MTQIKDKQTLVNALELTLVHSIQVRDIQTALKCSKMLKLLIGGNHNENQYIRKIVAGIRSHRIRD